MLFAEFPQIIRRLLNPALCQTCGIPVATADFICAPCLQSLDRVENPCALCGLPNRAAGPVCPKCQLQPPRWQGMTAPLVFGGSVRRLIHEFKFNERLHLGNTLITHLHAHYPATGIERIVPVPLHRERLLQRGFNQSEEIARMLSLQFGIKLDRHSLQRVRATQSQSGLSLHKRRKNLHQAFVYRPLQKIESVAIVDDVITTGSTVSEICKVLHRQGVKNIQVWSLARALRQD